MTDVSSIVSFKARFILHISCLTLLSVGYYSFPRSIFCFLMWCILWPLIVLFLAAYRLPLCLCEGWIGKDFVGSYRCLIVVLSRNLPGGTEENHVKLQTLMANIGTGYCGRGSSWVSSTPLGKWRNSALIGQDCFLENVRMERYCDM
jgi:hypothetical protein